MNYGNLYTSDLVGIPQQSVMFQKKPSLADVNYSGLLQEPASYTDLEASINQAAADAGPGYLGRFGNWMGDVKDSAGDWFNKNKSDIPKMAEIGTKFLGDIERSNLAKKQIESEALRNSAGFHSDALSRIDAMQQAWARNNARTRGLSAMAGI